MPESRTETSEALLQARLVCWACAVIAVGASFVWVSDQSRGLNTQWDLYGGPAMILTYALAALGIWRWPHRLNPIMVSALIPTSIYHLGVLYSAAQDHSPTGLYSMASGAQFMPLFYVAAFVALRRGAAWVSSFHYVGLVGLYVLLNVMQPARAATAADQQAHLWVIILVSHPCYIITLYYITALKGRLRHAERASHESKERFLAMLSHEIRSPLQAMLGSIDLLALNASSPPQQRAIQRLRHAAGQLDTHLRDVTEYTRLENPAWRLNLDTVDLVRLVQDVCDQHQPQAQARGLLLDCSLPPPEHSHLHRVWTDERRLRQILANLIGNALKYTPQGHITVRLSSDAPGSPIHLSVEDSGIGIPTADQQRIFEPYVRLEDQRVRHMEGSGLGLAVVKRLADRLGAHLDVVSAPDQGSTFTLTLPGQT